MKTTHKELEELIEVIDAHVKDVIQEKRIREVDVTDGKAQHGSPRHIKDLKVRIADMVAWRNRQPKGTVARDNYARVVARLKAELKSAERVAARNKVRQVAESNQLTEATEEDVQSELVEFDSLVAELVSKSKKEFRTEFTTQGVKFSFSYITAISPTAPYVVYVDDYEAGHKKTAAETIAVARNKLASIIRKRLKVKAPVKGPAEPKYVDPWKDRQLSAMTDSNGKRFDPAKRFK